MAQQYQQPPRTYSPLPRTDSPHHGQSNPYPPPINPSNAIKRQPLSPNPQSPYGSPNNIQLPNQVFSSPYYGSHANGASANHSYNPYQQPGSAASPSSTQIHNYSSQASSPYSPNTHYNPYAAQSSPNTAHSYNTIPAPPPQPGPSGAMGPPSRPAVDKPTDINELGDVMANSGIDLREEEAALSLSFARAQQRREGGYGPTSGAPNHTAPRENYYMQNTPGDRNSFYGSGTFNQAPEAATESAEDLAAEARKKALRKKAEIHSYHLNDPFLYPKVLIHDLKKQASTMSVVIPSRGHYNPQARPSAPPRELLVQGPDKNWVLKSVTGEELLDVESPCAEILALISLAAQERIRGLVEDAAALAKGRRMGSHGVAPLELADITTGSKASESVVGLPTPSNSAVSPTSNPLKRSYSEMNKPLTPVSDDHGPATTKIFVSPVAKALNKIAQAQRKAEEDRLAKRQRRSAAEGSQAGSGSVGTPGTPGEVAPAVEAKKGGKGKKAVDTATQKANEAQQHAATMQTMNYALGLSGAMGKKLSWMNKGAAPVPSNPFLAKPNTNASNSKAGASNANGVGSGLPKERALGEFREDKEAGAGIQLRDVISALEHDGKERKALQRAYYKQGQAGQRR